MHTKIDHNSDSSTEISFKWMFIEFSLTLLELTWEMKVLLNHLPHGNTTYNFMKCSLKVLFIKEESTVVMFQSTAFVIKD